MKENLSLIISVLIEIFIGVLGTFFIYFIKQGINYLKSYTYTKQQQNFLDSVQNLIIDCVECTNQTFVDELKKENSFDLDAQRQALQITYERVINLLTPKNIEILSTYTNDIEEWIKTIIESYIKSSKKN